MMEQRYNQAIYHPSQQRKVFIVDYQQSNIGEMMGWIFNGTIDQPWRHI
jgi:hypothetical protein